MIRRMHGTAPAAVVDPKYILGQEVVLVMQEALGYKSDNFKITDQNGTPYFM
jgi:hypothetical protein